MKSNKHSQSIPAATLEQAKAKIEEAASLLKPYLIALTAEEKQEIPKMGPKTFNFVEKAHEYAHENSNLAPTTWTWQNSTPASPMPTAYGRYATA
jgi:hypothetical protein